MALGFVERVTTGLYLAWFGYAEESGRFLDSAALLAALPAPRKHPASRASRGMGGRPVLGRSAGHSPALRLLGLNLESSNVAQAGR